MTYVGQASCIPLVLQCCASFEKVVGRIFGLKISNMSDEWSECLSLFKRKQAYHITPETVKRRQCWSCPSGVLLDGSHPPSNWSMQKIAHGT